jgi:hypothetical protein
MKKITMMMLVVAAAVSFARAEDLKIDFDGRTGGAAVSAGEIGAYVKATVAAAPAPAVMPERNAPEFSTFQLQVMNGAINDVIRRNANNPALAKNFTWLLRNATAAEKASFVYAKPGSVYKFPKACYASDNKGLWDDLVEWVCETVTTIECVFTCSFGEGDTDVATNCYNDCHEILVESCHQK